MRRIRQGARGRGLVLVALLLAASSAGAFKVGPKPTKPAGLIVRYRTGGVGIAAAAAAIGGTSAPKQIAPDLFKVDIKDGTPAAVKAAQIARLASVAYVAFDQYVSIGGLEDADTSAGAAAAAAVGGAAGAEAAAAAAAVRSRRSLLAVSRRPSPPPLMKRRPSAAPSQPAKPTTLTPNDSYYKNQWALPKIRAPQAWTYATSSAPVLQCIVDTGVMWDHPDLIANLMKTPAAYQSANYDDNGHGTHVAGILGAVSNNFQGIAGTSWKANILACKALDSTGWGLISKVIECIEYCRSKGAKVINTSFVLTDLNLALRDSIANATAAGVFFAGAAGNDGTDNDVRNNYPAGFKYPGNVAVANIQADSDGGGLHISSNFGRRSVQVAAPGTDILSTWIWPETNNQYYTSETGTSMAAPYVCGSAALAIAASGGRVSNAEVAQALVATSTPDPRLSGKVVANGFINLEKLVIWAINRGKQIAAARAAG